MSDRKDEDRVAIPRLWFGFGKHLPVIFQSESSECGLACLVMIARYFGSSIDLIALRGRFLISLKGSTLKGLMDAAAGIDLSSRPLRVELGELSQLRTPCVIHWDLNHFVVLKRVLPGGKGIIIHDPARGALRADTLEVSRRFTGIALELTPTRSFKRDQPKVKIRLREMMGQVTGLKRSLLQILLISAALEVFSLVSPFFMQWVVDGAILSNDTDLLAILVIGFGLLMVLQIAIGLARSWTVMYMSTHLNLQWVANVFTHLLRLPMSYFEKRHLGDVISRFGAVNNIQRTLTTNFVEAIIDGLLAIATLGMMLVYSVKLSIIIFCSIAIYGLLRSVAYLPFRRANEEQIVLAAREQSIFLESIRGIQSIKLFNHEDERRARWLNALVDATNRGIATQKMGLGFSTAHSFVGGLENLLVVWFGATLVMNNAFSVGMLFAFMSYKTTFTTRTYALIDKWVDLKMLSLQGERLADIVLTPREGTTFLAIEQYAEPSSVPIHVSNLETFSGNTLPSVEQELINTTLEVRGLSFRYSDIEPWVLKNFNLKVVAGEAVALVGPSGCGKTTLVKLLIGLLQPSEGEILVGGVPLERLGLRNYRNAIGAVMQEDQMLTGSISDNISFFDLQADQSWIEECADAAAFSQDIKAMPMGYYTLIGDMGSSLSGGQKQRLLLARALYKRPKLLFLDEATSHLDLTRESMINKAIRALPITRIIVAHRKETIEAADRVVEVK